MTKYNKAQKATDTAWGKRDLSPMVVNVKGTMTLARKEVGRFLAVYSQTIIAPIMTTLLFYAVFHLAFSGAGRGLNGVDYMTFLAPGLIMMGMAQNAFANTSSSLAIAKNQGSIADLLMAPLSPGEVLTGFALGGIARGVLVGLCSFIALSLFMPLPVANIAVILAFSILGTLMLALLGTVGGIWAEKFDHIAFVTNFIVTPMTFLSGTFYTIERLPGIWQDIAHLNPFFYMIDGFRGGFIGVSDSAAMTGIIALLIANAILWCFGYWMLKSGYKIKS